MVDGDNYYINVQVGTEWKGIHVESQSNNDYARLIRHRGNGNLFRFHMVDDDNYYINVQVGTEWKGIHVESQSNNDYARLIRHRGNGNLFQIEKTNQTSNDEIILAHQAWERKNQELNQAKGQLKLLNAALIATPADKAAWDARLKEVISLVALLQKKNQ